MAEGPSIVILKEKAGVFIGRDIVRVEGDTPIAKERLPGQRIVALRSFGKHFLVIKNEILFRIRVHPLSVLALLPPAKLRALVAQARQYTFEFYEWKKADVDGNGLVWQGDTLSKHWLVHNKKICPRCDIALIKAHTGALDRRSFYCERCQPRYG